MKSHFKAACFVSFSWKTFKFSILEMSMLKFKLSSLAKLNIIFTTGKTHATKIIRGQPVFDSTVNFPLRAPSPIRHYPPSFTTIFPVAEYWPYLSQKLSDFHL